MPQKVLKARREVGAPRLPPPVVFFVAGRQLQDGEAMFLEAISLASCSPSSIFNLLGTVNNEADTAYRIVTLLATLFLLRTLGHRALVVGDPGESCRARCEHYLLIQATHKGSTS